VRATRAASQTFDLQTHGLVRQTHVPAAEFVRQHESRKDDGLEDLCLVASEFRDFLETEATAGIEPAMKVLQIDGSVREPRREKPRKFQEIASSD
jgi:hypothetical protein